MVETVSEIRFGRSAVHEHSAPHDCFVEVQGLRVHYVRSGAGPPLVLIPGLIGSTTNWRNTVSGLVEHAAVYSVDLANMGRSDRRPGLDTGLAATADRVAAWMDAVGIPQADIAGHSHGGAVVMMLATRRPDLVRSIILFAPANPYSTSSDWLIWLYGTGAGRLLARTAPYMPRWVQLIGLGRMYGDPKRIRPGALEGYMSGLRVPGSMTHVLEIVRRWSAEMQVLKAALPMLAKTPVLLVWGDRDRAVSLESGVRLHGELPRSEWVVIEGAGHVAFEEMPERCNLLLVGWMERMREIGAAREAISGEWKGLAEPAADLRLHDVELRAG